MALWACASIALISLVIAPIVLARATWGDQFPRLGIATWYAFGAVGWIALISSCLAVTLQPLSGSLFDRSSQFVNGFFSGHPLRGLGLHEAIGLTLTVDLVVLLVGSWVFGWLNLSRRRRHHGELLDLLAEADEYRGVSVINHDEPLAYFLPGERSRVVLSSGTLNAFDAQTVDAITAHEFGHQHGRHGLVLLPLSSMYAFFDFVPYARLAPVAIRALVEMAADDIALKTVSRSSLQRALRTASLFAAAPHGAIAWTGSVIERRICRLELRRRYFAGVSVAFSSLGGAAISLGTAWLAH